MAKQKSGGQSKSKNDGPARKRYWASRRLELKKVKNLMTHCGMTRADALVHWRRKRKTRIPSGYIKLT